MIPDPLVQDLLKPENLPEPEPERIEFIQTHASYVFLTPTDVYKVKRAKNYGFFDYSTIAARKHFCEEEVRLNRRMAPGVYLGVRPVFQDVLGHSLTRPGPIVDYAVHMRRLPDEQSVLFRVKADQFGPEDVRRISRLIARIYATLPAAPPNATSVRHVIRENFKQVEPYIDRFIPRNIFEETRDAQEAWLSRQWNRLETRERRDGHGDLRLEHVYLTPSGPAIIDCIEFSDAFRILDPALDYAFFAMELYQYGRADLAELFLGYTAYERDDYDFYPLIDGYMSYRAWVRGKVACFLAADPQTEPALTQLKAEEARRFFERSHRFIRTPKTEPQVIAIGGMIGSGKSTLAEAVGRKFSIPVVNADATRKFLGGVQHEAAGSAALYDPAFTERVYDEVLRRAGLVLESGRSVIIDSTFRSKEFRLRARKLSNRFRLLLCEVPESVARERLRARSGGVSDAREDLYDSFKKSFEPVTEQPHQVIDMTRPLDEILPTLTP
jgi:hypothetical protein